MANTIGTLPKVRFGEWIGEGWNMFAEQWKVWVLNALVLSFVIVVPLVGIYVFMVALVASAGTGGAGLHGSQHRIHGRPGYSADRDDSETGPPRT